VRRADCGGILSRAWRFAWRELQQHGIGYFGDGTVVVGDSWIASGTRGFRWTSSSGMVLLNSSMTNAYTLSTDGSTIVGRNALQAVYWSAGVVTPLPMSYAYGISADGSVIAGIGSGQSSIQAYRWTSATGAVPLGIFPAAITARRKKSRGWAGDRWH